MEKKYLKLTPAGQMATKKITVPPLEKAVLERVQKEAGFVLLVQTVYDEQLDHSTVKDLLQKGWLRETDIGAVAGLSVPAPTTVPQSTSQTSTSQASTPDSSTSVPTPVAVSTKDVHPVVLPKIDVSEEDKARSYEDFMKIMGSK